MKHSAAPLGLNPPPPQNTRVCEFSFGECRTNFLPLLYEMNRIATESGDLGELLDVLLQVMQRYLRVVRGSVSLYEHGEAQTARIFIHKSCGMSEEEAARGIYAPGEGIIGKVVETGRPIIVPKISDDPEFLEHAIHREDEADRALSFLCIPIQYNGKVLGTISAERLYDNRSLLKLDARILEILAASTAQSVELYLAEKVQKVELEDENRRLRSALRERFKPANIIGNSRPMQDVYALIQRVIRSRTTALILGESGVGKELVASAIHYNSPHAKGPFIRFNCAALQENVVESELFGHEKGAFTGAANLRRGRFEEADGGTIFLDEVGELSPSMQAKLLRVLQEKSFERVGAMSPCMWIFASSPLPTAICKRWSKRDNSARICITASIFSRSPFRRCANAAMTSPPWRNISCIASPATWVSKPAKSPPRRSEC